MTSPTSTESSYSPWYLRYIMVITFLVGMISLMDRYVVSILMEQIKHDLSLTDTQLGWLVGPAFVIVHILSQLPLARMADRSVRRNMVAISMALWSLCTIFAGFTKNFSQLFITRMGVGITEAASAPALASMISDYFPAHRRGRALSMLSVGSIAGIGAGMLMGGIVGQMYGWRVALIVAGIPGIMLSIVVWFSVKEPLRGSSDGEEEAAQQQLSVKEVFSILVKKRAFCWMLAGASLSMVAGLGRGAWEPVFLMRVYEMDQATAGIAYFLISPLPAIVGGILGGILLDRLVTRDRRWFLWLPAIVMIVNLPMMIAFLLWPVGDTMFAGMLPVGFAFSIVGSIISAAVAPAIVTTAQNLVGASMRAMTHAIWSMAANLVGMGLGPVAAGWLSEQLAPSYGIESIRYALVIISTVAIPGALALWMGSYYIRDDLHNDSNKT